MAKAKKRAEPTPATSMTSSQRKAIEEMAYFRWLARNREHGKDLEDWLDAEQELMENVFEHDVES